VILSSYDHRGRRERRVAGGTVSPIPESLLTIAQLALGLAGFSGVILVFSGSPDAMHPLDRLRMRMLLAMSLGAMILSILPFGIALLGAEGDTLWRICSGALVVTLAPIATLFFLDYRNIGRAHPSELAAGAMGGGAAAVVAAVGGAAMSLLALAHTLGALRGHGRAVFFFFVFWLLSMSAFLFTSLIFVRPRPR
jgi:hypothetical protein